MPGVLLPCAVPPALLLGWFCYLHFLEQVVFDVRVDELEHLVVLQRQEGLELPDKVLLLLLQRVVETDIEQVPLRVLRELGEHEVQAPSRLERRLSELLDSDQVLQVISVVLLRAITADLGKKSGTDFDN